METDAQLKALTLALKRAKELLNQPQVRDDEIHAVKSVLYVAIERLGIKVERLIYSQRLLRELFSIVTMKGDLREYEKGAGFQILEELNRKFKDEVLQS